MRISRFYNAVRPYRFSIANSFMLQACEEILYTIAPYGVGLALTAVAKNETDKIIPILGAVFAVEMFARALGWRRAHVDTRLHYRLTTHLSTTTLHRIIRLSVGQFKSLNSAQVQRIVKDGESAVWNTVRTTLFDIVPMALRVAVGIGALAFLDIRLGAILFLGLLVVIGMMFHANRTYAPEIKHEQDEEHVLNKDYTEIVRNISVALINGRAEPLVQDYAENRSLLDDWGLSLWRRFMKWSEARSYVIDGVSFGTMALAFVLVAQGSLEVGILVPVMSWIRRAVGNMGQLQRLQRDMLGWFAHAERYFMLMDLRPAVVNAKKVVRPKSFRGAIKFSKVSFKYPFLKIPSSDEKKQVVPERTAPALRNVTLSIPAGARVAFVGPSGAGKTTIAGLILRAYDPTSGTVSVDGKNLKSIDLDAWRNAIGYVEQDVTLFDRSIRYNITLGNEMSDEELDIVASLAQLDELKSRLTYGWDTLVGEKGVRLSGGERQRVGIARALARNPSVLLLDEATSSLDARSEHRIQKAIDSASEGRTTIIIAHRLSTVMSADIIFVVDGGEIVAHGTHMKLLLRSPLYAELVSTQMIGSEDDE